MDKHGFSATERARLILDFHTAMTHRDPSAVALRLADVIAALLTLANHWDIPTGPLLEEAKRQVFGVKVGSTEKETDG